MEVEKLIDRLWWTQKIAIIKEEGRDLTGREIKKKALFYGIADEYNKEYEKELNKKKVEGIGAINNRIIIIIEE